MKKLFEKLTKKSNFAIVIVFLIALTLLLVIFRIVFFPSINQNQDQFIFEQRTQLVKESILNQKNNGEDTIVIDQSGLTPADFEKILEDLKKEDSSIGNLNIMPSGELLREWLQIELNGGEGVVNNPPEEGHP